MKNETKLLIDALVSEGLSIRVICQRVIAEAGESMSINQVANYVGAIRAERGRGVHAMAALERAKSEELRWKPRIHADPYNITDARFPPPPGGFTMIGSSIVPSEFEHRRRSILDP